MTSPAAPCSAKFTGATGGNRYDTLDAMRGIAALAVAMFHFDLYKAEHGYLAVDFFFALSGFVLWRTYEPRWRAGLGVGAFMRQRVIRLYPLFALGVLLSSAAMLIRLLMGERLSIDVGEIGLSTVLNGAMLPSPVSLPLFPLNIPSWSLFFELVANFVLIVLLFRLPAAALVAICVFSAAFMTPILLVHGSGNIGALWGEITIGLTRTAFSFVAGLLIARLPQPTERPRGAIGAHSVLAIIVVLCPKYASIPVPVYDLFVVFVASPLLLLIGSRFELPRALVPAGALLGDVSYALYAVHWPFIEPFRAFRDRYDLGNSIMAPVFIACMVLLAWACVRWIDIPARRWINARFPSSSSRTASLG